ncbi:ABC transporter substrate-binding protein [Rhizobium daejeonense]|nr:ABC transporter substrate-binding protein [Rhizobium daejeonense]
MSLPLPFSVASAGQPRRIAALDWTSAQNLLALGANVVALPELHRYRERVVEPQPQPGTYDLGLRSEPNLELLDSLAPDLIVMHPELETLRPSLNTIATVTVFDPDASGDTDRSDRLSDARQNLNNLARSITMPDAFAASMNAFEAAIAEAATRLRGHDGRPAYIVTLMDTRRALVFGRNSLFQSVFDLFSIENAWDGPTSPYGHTTITLDALAGRPDASLLSIGRESRQLLTSALRSPVVASLPYVRENRAVAIDDVLFYGGLPSAQRFARLASMALSGTASQ